MGGGFENVAREAYPQLRLLAMTGWAFSTPPSVLRSMEYEDQALNEMCAMILFDEFAGPIAEMAQRIGVKFSA